jgi:hypothetical protein
MELALGHEAVAAKLRRDTRVNGEIPRGVHIELFLERAI